MMDTAKTSTNTIALLAWIIFSGLTFSLALSAAGTSVALLTLLSVVVAYWVFRALGDPFVYNRVTILNFWFVAYLFMIFLPAFFVYADQPGPYRGRYLFAVTSALITVPLGGWFANLVANFQHRETRRFFSCPIVTKPSRTFEKKFGWFFVVLLVLTAVYVAELPSVPLFALFQGGQDYRELMLLREESYKLLESRLILIHHFVRTLFYPFLVLLAQGYLSETRARKWKVLFTASLFCAVLYCSLTLAKAPVSNIFLMMILLWYYQKGGEISLKGVLAGIGSMLLFPIVLFFALFSDLGLGLGDALLAIGERVFYSPSEVVYYYYEVFPAKVDFLYGRSIGRIAWLFGVDYFNTPNFVGQYGFPQYQDTINANGAFIADLNADFGLLGVCIGGLVAGAIMQLIHIYMVRRPKTIISLATYAFLAFGFWGLNQASLFYVLASNGTILALLMWAGFEYEARPRVSDVTGHPSVALQAGE
jgi:oligosaccharide repeat unit polymerase